MLVMKVNWLGRDIGGLPTSMAGRGLIGTVAGKLQNWSLAVRTSRLGGVRKREDVMVKPWMR